MTRVSFLWFVAWVNGAFGSPLKQLRHHLDKSVSRLPGPHADRTFFSVPLTQKLQRVVEDLSVIDDPQERLGLLVDQARKRPTLPLGLRTDAHRVAGCVSVVWLVPELRDGRCYFSCDAESPVVRGLVGFLCEFFSGFAPEVILSADSDPLEALGLTRYLSPTRRNGLNAARAAIRAFAAQQASAPRPSSPAAAP